MNEKTKQFLEACRQSGYTRISVGVPTRLVPASLKTDSSHTVFGWPEGVDRIVELQNQQAARNAIKAAVRIITDKTITNPIVKVQKVRELLDGDFDNTWPAIWRVVQEQNVSGGCGNEHSHQVAPNCGLEQGVYKLTKEGWVKL